MTVQELIDELQQVENKDLEVYIEVRFLGKEPNQKTVIEQVYEPKSSRWIEIITEPVRLLYAE